MLEVIRSYLVSLGYEVDQPSFNKAQSTVDQMGKTVAEFSDGAVADFAVAGAAVVAFVAIGAAALTKFVTSVGQSAIQNEIFAREMWMNVDAAVAYRNSLQALGASLQDLYLSPVLMKQFQSLQQEATQIGLPPAFQQAMAGTQNLTLQFDRLKLEASYSIYWIGYYITKYMAGPIQSVNDWLTKVNDTIVKQMPVWTKDVAQVAAGFGRMANALYIVGQTVVDAWQNLGGATQQLIGILAGAGGAVLVLANPVTALIAGMSALLLLVDDYYTYEHGGQSALPGLWSWIDKMNKQLQNAGVFSAYKQSLQDLADALGGKNGRGGLAGAFIDVLRAMGTLMNSRGTMSTFVSVLTGIFKSFNSTLKATADILRTISGLLTMGAGAMNNNPKQVKQGQAQASKGASGLFSGSTLSGLLEWSLLANPATMGGGIADLQMQQLLQNFVKALVSAPKKAAGGTSSGGMTLVGERGPELVRLPVGSQVTPTGNLMDLWRRVMAATQTMATTLSQGLPQSYPARYAGGAPSIQISPTYHIHGATDPNAVASAIQANNNALLIRSLQGVLA